jgi:amino acid transporter
MEPAGNGSQPIKAHLGLWDAVSIIIGIVIGSTIFQSPPIILKNVLGPWTGLSAWALGGALSLIGAFCYAELATAYPRSGGDYVYLTRAFGPWMGFLFGWGQLVAIRTSSIGSLAFVFGGYAARLWNLEQATDVWFAIGAVAALTLMNVVGVVFGKWTQNILTTLKVVGLSGIVIAGLGWGKPGSFTVEEPISGPGFGLAMIFVLYAYGGWNDAALVAAELRQRRHIALALILGTSGITLIYLAVNVAYIWALGFEGVRQSSAVAADVLKLPLKDFGEKAMCLLVMIAALSSINGVIFTGSRVYATLGTEHSIFTWLGRWHERFGTPLWALVAQALITLAMILGVGTEWGRQAIDQVLILCGLAALPWEEYFGGFGTLVTGTAPVFWGFFLLSGLSLFVLRERDQRIERPFTVPLFPVLPLVFCATSFYMLYQSIKYAGNLGLMGAIPLFLGLPLYLLSKKRASIEAPVLSE